jgi:hypothetical protein
VDGDSSYNRRHGNGHFKGESYIFGALVDCMPQTDMKLESIGNKKIQGVFIGYIVADNAPFKKNCDATPAKMKTHRIKEVLNNLSGVFVFPVAERRKERILKDQDFNAPEEMPERAESDDEGMPNLVDTSDDEGDNAESLPRPGRQTRNRSPRHRTGSSRALGGNMICRCQRCRQRLPPADA